MPGRLNRQQEDTISKFDEMTRNAKELQEEVLKTILQRNSGIEYLMQYGLNGRTDPQTFKNCVPLVSHADIQSYIERIVNGDKSSILTADPIETISLSSGTTNGHQKHLLLYKEIFVATLESAKIAAAFRSRVYPIRPDGKILEFVFCGKLSTTKGGLRAGTATTHLFRSQEFKQKQKSTRAYACSPDEVVFGSYWDQSMYCHLLCGLLFCQEVQFVTSTFAYSLVEAFRTFEREWHSLCNDIRQGQLNSKITDSSIRHAMSEILRADPELADAISQKCHQGDFRGIIQKLWPNCKYVYSIMTGSMEPYLTRLKHYAGELPLVSADYGATEGWIAVNVNPESLPNSVSFTVVPSFGFFEFIPLRRRERHGEADQMNGSASTAAYEELSPVGLTEVQIGQEYEVVMTTYGGLYRYRLGDVVRVTGFYNSSPQLAYVCRKNVILTVHIDKNTEKDLQIVVSEASKLLNNPELDLVDYTSYVDLSTTPGHYVVFWELSKSCLFDEAALNDCASLMDRLFVDPGYRGSRAIHTIGPLELCIVRPGTFRAILERYLTKGAAITQYKTPRCMSSGETVTILQNSTVRRFLSSKFN